jgi:hypothetical protein
MGHCRDGFAIDSILLRDRRADSVQHKKTVSFGIKLWDPRTGFMRMAIGTRLCRCRSQTIAQLRQHSRVWNVNSHCMVTVS